MNDQRTLTVGLRFDRRDARVLQALVDRCMSEGIGREHTTLFRQAAGAARSGEPLLVECMAPEEAVAMADGFTLYGVRRPAVEALQS